VVYQNPQNGIPGGIPDKDVVYQNPQNGIPGGIPDKDVVYQKQDLVYQKPQNGIPRLDKYNIYKEEVVNKYNNPYSDKTLNNKNNTLRVLNTKSELNTDLKLNTDTDIDNNIKYIIGIWNNMSDIGLQEVTIPKGSLAKRFPNLVNRIEEYGYDNVLKALDKIPRSEFLLGNNKTGWKITFDWMFLPDNFQKVLDGKYDNRVAVVSQRELDKEDENDPSRVVREWLRGRGIDDAGVGVW
jgi:hypothetical protein